MAASDGNRIFIFEGTRLQSREQAIEIGKQEVCRTNQLNVEAGVEDVGRGHALVHKPGLRSDVLGQMREEGDHVVLRHGLDLVDPLDVEDGRGALFPYLFRRSLRNDA